MNDRTRRALRTLVQAAPPAIILPVLLAFGLINPVEAGVLFPVLTSLDTFALNLLEDTTGVSIGPSKQA